MTETIIVLHKEVLANPKILKERFAGIISQSSFNGLNITITKDWSYILNKGIKNKYILNINPEFSLKDNDIINIVKLVSRHETVTHIDQYYSLYPCYIFGAKPVTKETKSPILHITVGSKDWLPTKKQLDEVMELFRSSDIQEQFSSIVVTRKDIKAEVLSNDKNLVNVKNLNISNESEAKDFLITHSKFDSTDDERRIANNPEPLKDYKGPDDVSRLYRQLSEDEKKAMGDVKEMAQLFINKIREVCRDNEYRKEAIKSIQMGQMWAVKDITSSDKA